MPDRSFRRTITSRLCALGLAVHDPQGRVFVTEHGKKAATHCLHRLPFGQKQLLHLYHARQYTGRGLAIPASSPDRAAFEYLLEQGHARLRDDIWWEITPLGRQVTDTLMLDAMPARDTELLRLYFCDLLTGGGFADGDG